MDRWQPHDSWWPRLSVGYLRVSGDSSSDPALELLGGRALLAELQVDRNLARELTFGANLRYVDLEEDHDRFRYRDILYVGVYSILKPSLYESPIAPFAIANVGISDALRGSPSGLGSDPFMDHNAGGSSDDFRPYGGLGAGLALQLPADLAIRVELWLRIYDLEGKFRRANTIAVNLGRGL